MKPSLLSFESLRYLFGPGTTGPNLIWKSLDASHGLIKTLQDNCQTFGASLLLAPPGFHAETLYQAAIEQVRGQTETLCLTIPSFLVERESDLEPALLRGLATASPGTPHDWATWKQLLSAGALPWKRVIFALESAEIQLSALWLQPGSRTAGSLRRMLSHFRASEGRFGLLGFLDAAGVQKEGARLDAIIQASGDELAYLTEAFPGLVPFLLHLDMDGLSTLLRGPLLEVRRPTLVSELEVHPALRRCLANCLRLLPTWRANGPWYPLHPLAWAILPRLCALFPNPPQGERTFFGFFNDDIPGSLSYFLGNSKILSPLGEPNLYPLDALFQYFDWRGREFAGPLEALESACHKARNLPLARRLLRGLWLLQLLHHSAFPASEALLLEALQLSESESAKSALKKMGEAGILLHEGFGDELRYALPGRKQAGGPPAILQNYLKRSSDSSDLQTELRARLPLRRLKLYSFNRTHCSDRWVRVQLTTFQGLEEAGPIDEPESWWETQLANLGSAHNQAYEGDMLLLYVALLDQEERNLFQAQLMQGRFS